MRWDIGIDMGTENCRAAKLGEGPVSDIPAFLAYREDRDQPFALGHDAMALIGRASEDMLVTRPLRDGVLMDGAEFEKLVRYTESTAGLRENAARRFNCACTCAPYARQAQQDAMLTALVDTGAGEAVLVRSDYAAALGAGMDPIMPEAFMIADIGAGKVTCTIFTLGRIAAQGHMPYGLERLDQDIVRAVREKYAHAIGLLTARDIKHSLCTALPSPATRDVEMTVGGYAVRERQPEHFTVKGADVEEVCRDFVREVARMCRTTLADIPEELAADLNDTGCVLTGSGALLSDMTTLLTRETGIPCRLGDAPSTAAVRGLARMLREPEEYPAAVMSRLSRYNWGK